MKVLYNNDITSSTTITPSTQNNNYPFETAFLDTRMSRFGRFTGKTSENIVFYNSGGFSFDEVLIAANNMTSSATVTVQANASDSWGAPSVSESMTRLVNGYWYYNFSSVQSYDYIRIVVADATVTESYIKIAKVFIGQSLTLPGIAPTAELPVISNSLVSQNESGQVFADKRTQLKGANVNFPVISETERQNLKTLFTSVDKTDPIYLFIWENDLDIEPPLYCTLTTDLEIKKANGISYSANFSFIENK